MVSIPKIFIKTGETMTDGAAAAVKRVKNATKPEVFNVQKLNESSEDLFVKQAEMDEAFWHDPDNLAQYVRGQFIADGGSYERVSYPINTEKFLGDDVKALVGEDGKLKISVHKYGTDPNTYVSGYNPETGKREVTITLNKDNEIVHINKADEDGEPIMNIIPERDGHPRKETDLDWDGGYPYRTRTFYPGGEKVRSIDYDQTRTFYTPEGMKEKAIIFDNPHIVATKDKLKPKTIQFFDGGETANVRYSIDVDPDNPFQAKEIFRSGEIINPEY